MAPGTKRTTRSQRAGVVMPVSRFHRNLKKARVAARISSAAPVYIAGAIEYLLAELIELSGEIAAQNKKHRITPRHVLLAIRNDAELNKLLAGVTIPASGVPPSVHPNLMKTKAEILKARAWDNFDVDGDSGGRKTRK